MTEKMPLIVIAGPTGIGKSALALKLAQKLGTELISADSRQIYKEFDIGTAKPTMEEQQAVKHHLIDIKPPTELYTVAEYVRDAKAVIENIYSRGNTPILVGGTGLYIRTLIEGYSIPEIKPLPELREELKKEAEEKGNAYLYKKAEKLDPEAVKKLHENDLFRVIRVIEVYESTGKKISELQGRNSVPEYNLIYIGLNAEREKLYERIGQRVELMVQTGLADEVKGIIDKYGKDLKLLDTINYREIREYILGSLSLEEAKELMKKNTRNFAKRQLTWFRNDQYLIWRYLETLADLDVIAGEIEERLNTFS